MISFITFFVVVLTINRIGLPDIQNRIISLEMLKSISKLMIIFWIFMYIELHKGKTKSHVSIGLCLIPNLQVPHFQVYS